MQAVVFRYVSNQLRLGRMGQLDGTADNTTDGTAVGTEHGTSDACTPLAATTGQLSWREATEISFLQDL